MFKSLARRQPKEPPTASVLSRASPLVPNASSTEAVDASKDKSEAGNEPAEPIVEPPKPAFSFEQYFERPAVQPELLGMTARVARILKKMDISAGDPGKSTVSERDRQQWRMERMALEDELRKLKEQLEKLAAGHGYTAFTGPIPEDVANLPTRPSGPGSEATELALLRQENFELRNMTREEKQGKARDIMLKLRAEIDALKQENTSLKRQLEALVKRKEDLSSLRPPRDVLESLKEYPFQISQSDRERIFAALDEEWKTATALSRHGSAEPLRNPFQRRT